MTDKEKLDKLVAEIKGLRKEVKDNIAELGNSESERVGLFKDLEIYDNILSFIDSMQKEPKECMYSKDNYTVEDRKVLCDGCEEECRFNKKEEPVSEDLEQAIDNYLATYFGSEQEKQEYPFLKKMAIHFANWQKEQIMAKAVDAVVKIDAGGYPYVDTTIELYDYVEDIPLAKGGDKYKVIVIKES